MLRFDINSNTILTNIDETNEKSILTEKEEFVKVIKKEYEIFEIPKKFYLAKDTTENYFAIFNSKQKLKTLFNLTNKPKLKEAIFKIYNLENQYSCVTLTSAPYSNLFVSSLILDIILTYADLEDKGIKPYQMFKKKSKNNKIRTIYAPNENMIYALENLNYLLQKTYDRRNEDFQVAYKKGKNVVSNASIHKDKKYIFNLDIKDFFPSCKRHYVEKYIDFLFLNCGNRAPEIKSFFLDRVLIDEALFIGSPIAGTLANAILSDPVDYIYNMTEKTGMSFSVYADDITFGSNKFICKRYVYKLFNIAFTYYNMQDDFKLNEKKSVGFSNNRRKITGVVVNHNDQLSVPQKYYRNLRVEIEKLAHNKSQPDIQKLRGQIAYAIMVDETGKVFRYLKKYEFTVKSYDLISDKKFEELEARFV